MAIIRGVDEEADRLYELLAESDPSLVEMEAGFPDYSVESKLAVVERVARTFAPPPGGSLVARLLMIRTPQNEAALRRVLVANLRSADPQARRVSLHGLRETGHPDVAELAISALRDEEDAVVATAIEILAPLARDDVRLRSFLEDFAFSRRGDERFHMSLGLLEAHGVRAALAEPAAP
jgi:hypothetical protein